MMILLSFNHTPPPAEVVRNGEMAAIALLVVLFFSPKVWWGAALGGAGSAIIPYSVATYATGDMGRLSQLINPPIYGLSGAFIGAAVALAGSSARKILRKSINRPSRGDRNESCNSSTAQRDDGHVSRTDNSTDNPQ